MGKRRHDPGAMFSVRADYAARGVDAFAYSSKVAHGAANMHPALNPAFGGLRESKDPEPGKKVVSCTVAIDVTGSNIRNARRIWEVAPQFFGLVTVQGYVGDHFNLQWMAIGDATCDKHPLQISPFEPDGATADKWLQGFHLESGGGGQNMETYEIAMWAAVRQNKLQMWERGEKGWMFIIFDEMPYPSVRADLLRKLYTADYDASPYVVNGEISINQSQPSAIPLPSTDIPTERIAQQLTQRYNVHCIIGSQSSYYNDASTYGAWIKLFGEERVHKIEDPGEILQMAAALMGQSYGISRAQILDDLKQLGTRSLSDINTAMTSIVPISSVPSAGSKIARI